MKKPFLAKVFGCSNNTKIRFDIQALRALAVIAVVIYHIWPHRLPGGFMGVDIFFVISGYLMTLTIWKSVKAVKKANKHKFRESTRFLFAFYARRIKRLAPAATACLLVVLAALLAVGKFNLQESTASQVISSAVFVQNWHLANESVDYLGQSNSATAVQHFWSLSIEEQFYMIWPLLLLFCGLIGFAIFRKSKNKIAKWGGVNLLLIVISVFTIATFIYGYWLTQTNPVAAYFVTPARIWELSMGGILVFLPKLKSRDLRLLLPWLGLAMCSYAIYKWNGAGFPGWHALVPTIGAALIIWAGGQKRSSKFSIDNLSKFRPAQFFGDISYSLYLYHWPLVILLPIIVSPNLLPGRWLKVIILLLAVVLAWLSYKFIETPTRKTKLSAMKVWLLGATCLAIILISAVSIKERATYYINNIYGIVYDKVTNETEKCIGAKAVQNQAECGNPFGKIDKDYAQFADTSFMATSNHPGGGEMIELCAHNSANKDTGQHCVFGDVAAKKTILLLGDSYSEQWYPAFDAIGRMNEYKIIGANSIICGGGLFELDNYFNATTALETSIANCNQRFNWIRSNLWAKADVIILATSPYYFRGDNNSYETRDGAILKLINTIGEINQITGKVPILMQSIPAPLYDSSLSEYDQLRCLSETNCVMPKEEQITNSLNFVYDRLIDQNPSISLSYLEIEDMFCDENNCHSQIGGLPVYYNTSDVNYVSHVNSFYSVSASEYIQNKLMEMLAVFRYNW